MMETASAREPAMPEDEGKYNVVVIGAGTAGPVTAAGRRLGAKYFVIAMGTRAAFPQIPGLGDIARPYQFTHMADVQVRTQLFGILHSKVRERRRALYREQQNDPSTKCSNPRGGLQIIAGVSHFPYIARHRGGLQG